jgi:serine/threonine protein kinase
MAADATPSRTDNPNALPPGTRLGEFELLSVLGVGGFGIVYLAFDHALEREVAIKEYMPATLAGRTETMHVSLRSHSDAETFALGLRSFVNEAKLLARFDHPSLLKVHRFWESNGTAYMAMPVLRGRNVKSIRGEMGGPPDEAWLRSVLMPLLGAIETLHQEGVYHRDIAPDNIQIEPDGRPVLLDFGAARRVLSDKSQALTAILKPAYAPIEQYGEAGSVKQGPWTDLYALGATLHYILLGRPPAPATARALDDEASALTVQALPGCSEAFLQAVDWMRAARGARRPCPGATARRCRAADPALGAHRHPARLDAGPRRSGRGASAGRGHAGLAPRCTCGGQGWCGQSGPGARLHRLAPATAAAAPPTHRGRPRHRLRRVAAARRCGRRAGTAHGG